MIIGSFKAGAGYLPLDPGLPAQRLSRIIDLSRTPLLVCTAACLEQAQVLLEDFACGARPKLLVWEELAGARIAIRGSTVPGQPRLRDLHLRLHRFAQGRDGRTARHAQ
jgi:non-ribosomal peptide synthetase component F